MFLPIVLLLIHPQMATNLSLSTENAPISASATISASPSSTDTEDSLPTDAALAEASASTAVETSALLPDAPVPVAPIETAAPMAFLNPGKPMTVSVRQLVAENRRKELMWKGLVIASSGAATFDAWSTRHAITTSGAQELNPLLKPFAGNASLYAAIQIGPALLDFAGRKMMYSRHSWMRRIWWVPQSASFVTSIVCGAHNVAYH
jgi:hypothetical protein